MSSASSKPPDDLDARLYQWLAENLRVQLDTGRERDRGGSVRTLTVKLLITDPADGKEGVISSDYVHLD